MKKPWLSKTLLTNWIVATAALIPGVDVWVAGHPTAVILALTGVNMALRLVSKEKIGLTE